MNRKNKKALIKSIILACLGVIALVGMISGVTYAKYYSIQSRQGISIASDMYFSSNVLVRDAGKTTDQAIRDIDGSAYPVCVNSERWTGKDTRIDIQIRNYDNNLLFNDRSLSVGYTICFYLLEKPEGATYYAVDTGAGYNQAIGTEIQYGSVLKFEKPAEQLPGGTLSFDTFQLHIVMDNLEEYNAAKVLVVAYPTSPDYVKAEDGQQQIYRLVGVFQGVHSDTVLEIDRDNTGCEVQSDSIYANNWKAAVADVSGLIYSVKTIGDVVADDGTSVRPTAIVRWNTKYLTISQYDDFYTEAKANQENNKDNLDWLWQEDIAGDTWKYMRISVMPYSSANITFYKTAGFDSVVTREQFEGLVYAMTNDEYLNSKN